MSIDIILLIVRIAIAVALYGFLILLFIYLWRDVQTSSQEQRLRQQSQGRLVVTKSDGVALEVGLIFPLQNLTTLGRGPTNTIVLPDTFASVRHAHVVCRRDQWWLEDQQSRNGTTLNDVPVKGAVVLSSGDEIGIGRVKLRFEVDS
jgi:hypothetical protein